MFGKNSSDIFPAVWLKEIRQTLHSKTLLILVVAIVALEILCGYTLSVAPYMVSIYAMPTTYNILVAVLVGIAMLSVGIRAESEAGVEGLDPLLCTQLTPFQVVLGKTLAMWCIGGVLFAISLPLWLWLPVVPLVRLYVLLTIPMVQLALLLMSTGSLKKLGSGLLSIVGGVLIVIASRALCEKLWVLSYLLSGLTVLFFTLNVTILTPIVKDRAMISRIVFLLFWAGLLMVLYHHDHSSKTVVNLLSLGATILFISSSFERLKPSRRMIMEMNKLELMIFPLKGGVGNGMFLGGILLAITFFVDNQFSGIYTSIGYWLFYANVVVLLRKFVSTFMAWIVVLAVTQTPIIIASLCNLKYFAIFSPAYVYFDPTNEKTVATIIAIVGVIFSIYYLISYWRSCYEKNI